MGVGVAVMARPALLDVWARALSAPHNGRRLAARYAQELEAKRDAAIAELKSFKVAAYARSVIGLRSRLLEILEEKKKR